MLQGRHGKKLLLPGNGQGCCCLISDVNSQQEESLCCHWLTLLPCQRIVETNVCAGAIQNEQFEILNSQIYNGSIDGKSHDSHDIFYDRFNDSSLSQAMRQHISPANVTCHLQMTFNNTCTFAIGCVAQSKVSVCVMFSRYIERKIAARRTVQWKLLSLSQA